MLNTIIIYVRLAIDILKKMLTPDTYSHVLTYIDVCYWYSKTLTYINIKEIN